MRHLKSGRQLGRNASHRKAMFRNMVVSLLNQENITTTDAKAKELRRYVEKLITLGKRGTLHARRRARVMVNDKEALDKLFSALAERYKERPGGYTRIVKIGYRTGDNAPLSVIQLVQEEMKVKKSKPKAKTSAKKDEVAEVKAEEKVEAAKTEAAEATSVETASAEAELVEAPETSEAAVEDEAKPAEASEPAVEAEPKGESAEKAEETGKKEE